MIVTSLRLYKKEKLCSNTAIDLLFSKEGSMAAIAFPLRAVWRKNERRTRGAQMQFMISVPKKRLRHAVDRVTLRRRIREAYRLNHHDYTLTDDSNIDVAFIYVANKLTPYRLIEHSMKRLLKKITETPQPAITDDKTSNQLVVDTAN